MLSSPIRILFGIFFIGIFSISTVSAQDRGIDTDELLEEYKSSKGYQQLQTQINELSPLADIELSFRLYRETASEREDVSNAIDNVFLIIEQYPCNTYGANPKATHFADAAETYTLEANIWDPECVALDISSDKLDLSERIEWNPEEFPSDKSKVSRQQQLALSDDYILEIESTWTRNKTDNKENELAPETATVTGRLMHLVPDESAKDGQSSEPITNSEITLPQLDNTVDTDRNGNFMIRDVPTGKLLTLIAQNPQSETPDTLRFVTGSDRLMDMGNLYIKTDEK